MSDRTNTNSQLRASLLARRKAVIPKPINSLNAGLIKTESLSDENELPLVVKPILDGIRLPVWAESNSSFIETSLLKYGGILFRNFKIHSVDDFESFARVVSHQLLEYKERSSPRSLVTGNVYTSTDYPADQSIFLHNENSYQRVWPRKIMFFCETPAQQGGETPVADCRRILRRINPEIQSRFLQRQWMYVRNFGHGFGLPWQTVFQTSDRNTVEEHCRRNAIEFEWKNGDCLRLRATLPAMTRHPETGEMIWFNHATFFHISTLEKDIREKLIMELGEERLPTNTYYGDGCPIEDSALEALREAYQAEKVAFPWKQGDVLLLDNMLVAHGRNPYVGPRRICVTMSDPYSRS